MMGIISLLGIEVDIVLIRTQVIIRELLFGASEGKRCAEVYGKIGLVRYVV